MGGKRHRNGIGIDLATADPSGVVEGDLWYRNDTHRLFVKNDTATCEIPQRVIAYNTATVSIPISGAKTTIATITLPAGTYKVHARGTVTQSVNSFTTQMDFTGTATVGYEGWLLNIGSGGISASGPNTAFGTTMTSSAAATLKVCWEGIIVVTVSGSLNWAATATGTLSAKTVNQGSSLEAFRLA